MDLNRMIEEVKAHPDYNRMGMIASHLGVVRENTLDGKKSEGLYVKTDKNNIDKIIKDIREMEGIYEVLVEVREGRLLVGDDIMAVVIGGDIREHVFPALVDTVNRIKTKGTVKKEFYQSLEER